MPQRVERIVIGRSYPNWKACGPLWSLSRKLGNCAVYLLRHRVFENLAPMSRAELDRALREQYLTDYRAMPSAASPQRHGQLMAKLSGFKKKYCAFCVGRNGYKIEDHRLSITGGELVDFQPLIVKCQSSQRFNVKATGGAGRRLKDDPPGQ